MLQILVNTNFDFVRWRRWAYLISGVAIAISVGHIALQGGLRYGIDFSGGTLLQVRFEPRAGRRRLVSIFEVTGLEGEVVTGNELWALDPVRDRLAWTGIRPRCLEKIAARGVSYGLPPAVEASP